MTLNSVNFNTTATYRCEVSGDAPEFRTAIKSAVLTVIRKCYDKPEASVVASAPSSRHPLSRHFDSQITSVLRGRSTVKRSRRESRDQYIFQPLAPPPCRFPHSMPATHPHKEKNYIHEKLPRRSISCLLGRGTMAGCYLPALNRRNGPKHSIENASSFVRERGAGVDSGEENELFRTVFDASCSTVIADGGVDVVSLMGPLEAVGQRKSFDDLLLLLLFLLLLLLLLLRSLSGWPHHGRSAGRRTFHHRHAGSIRARRSARR